MHPVMYWCMVNNVTTVYVRTHKRFIYVNKIISIMPLLTLETCFVSNMVVRATVVRAIPTAAVVSSCDSGISNGDISNNDISTWWQQ